MARRYDYTVNFRIEAKNFESAQAKAADIDRRIEKLGHVKTGEARLREREDEDAA
jgi:hypothetical protein